MYVPQERRAYILRILQQEGSIRSARLARELGVTDETIRTDLVDMQAQGLLQRVHGGARYIVPRAGADTSTRPDCQMLQHALSRVQPGMRIYLDAAPLSLVFVSMLRDMTCTLITNSPKILAELTAGALPHNIICPGGMLDKKSGLLDSSAARNALQRDLKPDLALLYPSSISQNYLGYPVLLRAIWARIAAESAGRTIAITPASSLNQESAHSFYLPRFTLITESNLPAGFSHADMELVPYISLDDLRQSDGFDY